MQKWELKGGYEVKKSIKFLMTTVALTAGVLAFSKAESKAAVVDIQQTDTEDTKITLQWSAALGAQSYAIQLSEDEIQTGLLWRQHQVQMKV